MGGMLSDVLLAIEVKAMWTVGPMARKTASGKGICADTSYRGHALSAIRDLIEASGRMVLGAS